MQTDQSSSEEDQVVKAADNSRCTPPSSYAFELLVKDDKYLYTDASWSQQSPLSMSRPATPDCLRQRCECTPPGIRLVLPAVNFTLCTSKMAPNGGTVFDQRVLCWFASHAGWSYVVCLELQLAFAQHL